MALLESEIALFYIFKEKEQWIKVGDEYRQTQIPISPPHGNNTRRPKISPRSGLEVEL